MIALLQRVREASVTIDDEIVAQIDNGLMVLVCAEREDNPDCVERLADKLLRYRVFSDGAGRMNRSLLDLADDAGGYEASDLWSGPGLLLVPQFTLAADTRSGLRPSFTPAAPPALGEQLFNHFVQSCQSHHKHVQCGRFGADMQVGLINDGPVTFWLQVEPKPVA
ncbi:MAG: D-aminoacyl-tRNA deacylase [Burkholderiaceae bacterium]